MTGGAERDRIPDRAIVDARRRGSAPTCRRASTAKAGATTPSPARSHRCGSLPRPRSSSAISQKAAPRGWRGAGRAGCSCSTDSCERRPRRVSSAVTADDVARARSTEARLSTTTAATARGPAIGALGADRRRCIGRSRSRDPSGARRSGSPRDRRSPRATCAERARQAGDAMGATLSAIGAAIASEWNAIDVANLQYWRRDVAAAGADWHWSRLPCCVLLVRAAIARKPGRHHVVVPAILQAWPRIALCVDPSPSGRAVRGRPAVRGARRRRSVFVAGRRERDLSGPPHQPDDRRVRQHADVVQGGDAQHPQRSAAGLLHDGRGGAAVRRAAAQGKVSRPDGARRIRQPRLRDHAVHERLRQPAPEHGADRRSGRVLDLPGVRHRSSRARSRRASRSSRRSIFSRRPAT